MTEKQLITGPDWLLWSVFVLLVAISAILLSGRGANLIAGYNTAPKKVKEKYDERKLCRVIGAGGLAIAVPLPYGGKKNGRSNGSDPCNRRSDGSNILQSYELIKSMKLTGKNV